MRNKQPRPDWRLQIVVRTSAPFKWPGSQEVLPPGSFGRGVGFVDYDSQKLAFGLPNATALFINLSKRHYNEALNVSQRFRKKRGRTYIKETDAFSYFENIMASILFAYTALESFANEEVPDDFIYIPKKSKQQKEYNKEKIERFISLGEKLSDVLPSALSLPSPTGTDVWDDFLALEKLRHSVIHMKMAERQHLIDTTDSVWSNLLKSPIPYVLPTTLAMINFFYKSRDIKPHWYDNMPFKGAI